MSPIDRECKVNTLTLFALYRTFSGWWRWALVSPDGVAPSRMVGVSASVNLPLHHKVQNFSSGTGSPGRKTVVCGVWFCRKIALFPFHPLSFIRKLGNFPLDLVVEIHDPIQ